LSYDWDKKNPSAHFSVLRIDEQSICRHEGVMH